MAFRWNDEKNKDGVPGMIPALVTVDPVTGTHGTLSKFDLHNTLIASGPDFRSGSIDELPTSNLDVASTVLHILGITPPQRLDGRILYEAMKKNDGAIPPVTRQYGRSDAEFSCWRLAAVFEDVESAREGLRGRRQRRNATEVIRSCPPGAASSYNFSSDA